MRKLLGQGLSREQLYWSFIFFISSLSIRNYPVVAIHLGATVIWAVMKLIKPLEFFDLMRNEPEQAVIAVGTLLATLITAPRIDRGIVLGILVNRPVSHTYSRSLRLEGRFRRNKQIRMGHRFPADPFCGRDRRRSGDLPLFRRPLCQLSYPTPTKFS